MNPDQNTTTEAPDIISPWLYLAGLLVTLSGMYAVNYGLHDPAFAMLTYGLAIGGYFVSYLLRVTRIPMRLIQTPALVALGLIAFAILSSDRGTMMLAPAGAVEDRAKGLQLVFLWLALFHSYLLTTDAAVLFACVPCMTMIALVSTTTTEPQIQNAFLVFIGASVFLMVHENYLRTRAATMRGHTAAKERRLFGGQLQLVALCLFGSLILANLVAVPIRTIGQTFFIPAAMSPLASSNKKNSSTASSSASTSESDRIQIANGPSDLSETTVMRVQTDSTGHYWRGATFDLYDGEAFENSEAGQETLTGDSPSDQDAQARNYQSFIPRVSDRDGEHFTIPLSPGEIPAQWMENSQRIRQQVTITNFAFTQIYGAANIEEVLIPRNTLILRANRALTTTPPLASGMSYQVISRVVDENPDNLSKIVLRSGDIPPDIARRYLQFPTGYSESNQQLHDLALQLSKGKRNLYAQVMSLKEYIEKNCLYNLLAGAAPKGVDRVSHFLFTSKQGDCTSFGPALVMLCRHAGIAARLASGYLQGDFDPTENAYIVKQKHKHVWAEVFFPRVGWVPFDATEGATEVPVNDPRNQEKDKGFLAWLRSNGWIPPAIVTVMGLLLLYVVKIEVWDKYFRRQAGLVGSGPTLPATNIEIVSLYQDACNAFARRGLPRPESATAREFAALVTTHATPLIPEIGTPLEQLTTLFTRFRYGPETASVADVETARAAMQALTLSLAKVKRGQLTPPVSSSEST